MPRYFDDDLLRRLRNNISWACLLKQLAWPHKLRQRQLAFLCPRCGEYLSAVNPRTNLGRCFYCETNFNPIDFTMAVRQCDFVEAVHYLKQLLPSGNRGLKTN
jgi:ribosomal protein S27AE